MSCVYIYVDMSPVMVVAIIWRPNSMKVKLAVDEQFLTSNKIAHIVYWVSDIDTHITHL